MKVREDVFCKWILPEIHHLIYQGFVNSRPRAIQSKDPVFTIFEDISLMLLLMQAKCHFKKKSKSNDALNLTVDKNKQALELCYFGAYSQDYTLLPPLLSKQGNYSSEKQK